MADLGNELICSLEFEPNFTKGTCIAFKTYQFIFEKQKVNCLFLLIPEIKYDQDGLQKINHFDTRIFHK